MHELPAAEDTVPHIVLGPRPLLGGLFALVVEVQADLGVNADAKIVVHHADFLHLIPVAEESFRSDQDMILIFTHSSMTYGGGVQSMMGVTGAQRASAEANTTMEIRPRFELRSKSGGDTTV